MYMPHPAPPLTLVSFPDLNQLLPLTLVSFPDLIHGLV